MQLADPSEDILIQQTCRVAPCKITFRTRSTSAIVRGHFVSYFHICAMLLFISQKLLPQLPPLPTSQCVLLFCFRHIFAQVKPI